MTEHNRSNPEVLEDDENSLSLVRHSSFFQGIATFFRKKMATIMMSLGLYKKSTWSFDQRARNMVATRLPLPTSNNRSEITREMLTDCVYWGSMPSFSQSEWEILKTLVEYQFYHPAIWYAALIGYYRNHDLTERELLEYAIKNLEAQRITIAVNDTAEDLVQILAQKIHEIFEEFDL
jgi:hypothetical protein